MKTLKQFCCITFIIVLVSMSAIAGDMHIPGDVDPPPPCTENCPPPPDPTQSASASGAVETPGAALDATVLTAIVEAVAGTLSLVP